jgi:hypothetical protein
VSHSDFEELMRTFRTKSAIAAAVLTGLIVVRASATSAVLKVTVGANVQVTQEHGNWPHYEVISCVNPTAPEQRLAAVMAIEHGGCHVVVYRSSNGGRTWKVVLSGGEQTADPTCAFGPDGAAYVGMLDNLASDESENFALYRSADGEHWGPPAHHQAVDREYLLIDRTRGPFHGSVYYVGMSAVRTLRAKGAAGPGEPGYSSGPAVFASRNRGDSFRGPIIRVTDNTQYAQHVSNPVILHDGSILVLFGVERDRMHPYIVDGRPNMRLESVRTNPGGTRMLEGTDVADWSLDTSANDGARIPALAVDESGGPYARRVYAAWIDCRSGRSQVLVAFSDSNGDRWSAPVVVDADVEVRGAGVGPDSTNVSVAVNNAGVVGVTWGDRREHADNRGWWWRFAASLDGGETFGPSTKISTAANAYDGTQPLPLLVTPIPTSAAYQPLQLRMVVMRFFYSCGDTVSMTTDPDGRFHPVWCDNRTGVSQMWTAPVTVMGRAIRNGDERLSNLEDVTKKIGAVIDAVTYDPVSRQGQLTVRLKNTSDGTVQGPLRSRVVDVTSRLGAPRLILPAPDEMMEFRCGTLAPGNFTEPVTIRFSMAGSPVPRPGLGATPATLEFLSVKLGVFAPK